MSINFFLVTLCLVCAAVPHETRIYGNYSGDILLAAFFPVHGQASLLGSSTSRGHPCGGIQPEDGIQAMEAFYYTLDKINSDPDLLPGFSLGAVVLDSCDDDTHALEQAVDLIRVLMTRNDVSDLPFRVQCSLNTTMGQYPFKWVAGVVGARTSSVSSQLASLFQLFQLPQVSYLSTSPDLSNPERFPFFKRTVPSDSYQARGMVELLREFKWTYVSMIYEDSNYGIKGYAELERVANEMGVCFAYIKRIDFNEPNWGPADYEAIIRGITEKARSNVAVLWADFPRARELFKAADRLNKTDMVWIGSDGWSGRKVPVDGLGHVVRDAITVQPLALKLKDFDTYFTKLNPATNHQNPWFAEYWEDTFKCELPATIKGHGSLGTPDNHKSAQEGRQCTGDEEINMESGYKQQLSLHFISDAAYAFAHALTALHNVTCGGKPGICENMNPHNISGSDLLKYLTDVSFDSTSHGKFRFINGMDGPARYTIMSYRELQPKNFQWVEAGTYIDHGDSVDEGVLTLEPAFRDIMSSYPPSSCSVPCGLQQARTYVKGERCCWVCANCTEWAIVIRISEDANDNCWECPKGMEPSANRTWCANMEATFIAHSNPFAIASISLSMLFSCLGTFTAIVFILYYKTPVIKASGRELSFILIGSAMVSYLSTFIFVAKPDEVICSLTRILLGLGYTSIYACILAKASRISRIFNDGAGSPKRARLTSPRSQLLIVGLLLLVEVLVLAVWFAASPPNTKYIFPNRATRLLVCSGSEDATYLITLIYPFLLMLFCLVYAFKTRKTPDGFNETRLIAFTSYTTVIIWLAFIPLYLISQHNIEVRITTLCMALSMNATVALLCLLSPKVYICIFRPEKNTREAVMMRSQSVLSSSSMPHNIGDLSQALDSPAGSYRVPRRNVPSIPNQPWQLGVVNVVNTSIPNQPITFSAERPRLRTNSGTQTTFSVAYYAPIYEVSEDEMQEEENEIKIIKIAKYVIKTNKATDDNDNTENVDTVKPQAVYTDIYGFTVELPGASSSSQRGYGRECQTGCFREGPINRIEELKGVDESSSTT